MKLHFPSPRHDRTKYIRLSTNLCKACWMCVQACPNDVIGKVDLPIHKHAHIDQAAKCRGCQKCVRACPNRAISYTGYEQSRKSERSPLERALKKVLPPTLLLVCLVLMVVSHWAFPVRTIFPVPFNLVGLAPLVLGVFTSVSANRQFAQVGTNVNTFNEPGTLVTDGWFSHSRNPMYLGCVLALPHFLRSNDNTHTVVGLSADTGAAYVSAGRVGFITLNVAREVFERGPFGKIDHISE
jgi:ferredoxin